MSLGFNFISRFVVVASFAVLAGCSSERTVHAFQGAMMGTTYTVTLVEGGEPNFQDERVLDEAESLSVQALALVDKALSTYKDDSDLMRFNQSAVGSIYEMGDEMAEVTLLSLEMRDASQGFFDPSVGALVSAWGFGAFSQDVPPHSEEIKALMAQSGMRFVRLIDDTRIQKLGEGFIDYSAIAKGYAVDKVAETLRSLGFKNFMVEVGGEVRVSGHNAEGNHWRLGIEQPDILRRKAYNIVHISDVSMATSGDYRNFIDGPDGRYSHTINPKTGYPVSSQIASVSVIMKDCASADAWATALLAMGKKKALYIAQEQDLAAFFIFREKDGFSSHATIKMLSYIH
jgi:thiamine biosynthesis lipoprotein